MTAIPEPLLSVVVPTHDVEPWVDELLQSILAQGISDMEVIVVDDHSGDRTVDRIGAVARLDARITLIQADRRGGANARNIGASVARGRYLIFADGDDIVPGGAYRALVDSLESTGSDMAFGDYLKFNALSTWSPTKNWTGYQARRESVRLADQPSLVRGRACWNKMFRRDFWERSAITYPEVARSNDIVPMTRAFLAARRVDVVRNVVYLYRERPGLSSMTSRAGADVATRSYFGQELECARMIADRGVPEISYSYSSLVLDSDAWVHISRYLLSLDDPARVDPGVIEVVDEFLRVLPWNSLNRIVARRRLFFVLLAAGEWAAAWRFVRATETEDPTGDDPGPRLRGWVAALRLAVARGVPQHVDPSRLIADGLVTLLAQESGRTDAVELRALIAEVIEIDLVSHVSVDRNDLPPIAAIVAALRGGSVDSATSIARVAAARPLVTDVVRPERDSLALAGPLDAPVLPGGTNLVAVRQGTAERTTLGPIVVPEPTGPASGEPVRRWEFDLAKTALPGPGRFELVLEYAPSAGGRLDVPVVTARMPLPPLGREFSLQPLSDRRRSWRFVVQRKPPLVARAAARATGAAGSAGRRLRRG